jgi:hypothetical protein
MAQIFKTGTALEGMLLRQKVVIGGTAFVDFFEEQVVEEQVIEEVSSEPSRDGYLQKIDGAVNWTIARAIRDATQIADLALQEEAAAWLWICCPDIAEQIELPDPQYEAMPTLATAYTTGYGGM